VYLVFGNRPSLATEPFVKSQATLACVLEFDSSSAQFRVDLTILRSLLY